MTLFATPQPHGDNFRRIKRVEYTPPVKREPKQTKADISFIDSDEEEELQNAEDDYYILKRFKVVSSPSLSLPVIVPIPVVVFNRQLGSCYPFGSPMLS